MRRALASVLLISAVLTAIWVGEFKVWYANFYDGYESVPVAHSVCIHTNVTCYPQIPSWALSVGIVIGVLGVLAAALLFSPRRRWPFPLTPRG